MENKVLKNNNKYSGNESKKLWVNLFEKAFAAYRKDKSNFDMTDPRIKNLNSSDKKFFDGIIGNGVSAKFALGNVNAGYAFIPLAAITGQGNCCYNINQSSIDSLKKGDCISFKNLSKALVDQQCLVTNHEYSILSVYNNGEDYLRLKNPWNNEKYYDLTKLTKKLDEEKIDFGNIKIYNKNDKTKGTTLLRRSQITPNIVNLIQSS